MFKTVNGFGLNYLLNELTVTQDYHNYNTRASSNNLIVLPRPHCELFKTSIKYYACDLWDSLPGHNLQKIFKHLSLCINAILILRMNN